MAHTTAVFQGLDCYPIVSMYLTTVALSISNESVRYPATYSSKPNLEQLDFDYLDLSIDRDGQKAWDTIKRFLFDIVSR